MKGKLAAVAVLIAIGVVMALHAWSVQTAANRLRRDNDLVRDQIRNLDRLIGHADTEARTAELEARLDAIARLKGRAMSGHFLFTHAAAGLPKGGAPVTARAFRTGPESASIELSGSLSESALKRLVKRLEDDPRFDDVRTLDSKGGARFTVTADIVLP